jgi:hypothetical protein
MGLRNSPSGVQFEQKVLEWNANNMTADVPVGSGVNYDLAYNGGDAEQEAELISNLQAIGADAGVAVTFNFTAVAGDASETVINGGSLITFAAIPAATVATPQKFAKITIPKGTVTLRLRVVNGSAATITSFFNALLVSFIGRA